MPRLPEFITFTGLDELTNLDRVRDLSNRFPLEFGVLFSPKRQGSDPRYPGEKLLGQLRRRTHLLHLSAHLCGEHARSVVRMSEARVKLDGFARVQVNHDDPHDGAIAQFARNRAGALPIAQTRGDVFPNSVTVSWLFDRSAGTGVAPSSWPKHPGKGRLVGYAGGIGPDNVREVLEAIDSDGPYWIDMESGVRSVDFLGRDWLDLDKCEAVCLAVYGDPTLGGAP